MNQPELSVVIPLYNEEENIQELCTQLEKALNTAGYSYEVIIVDDGSTDNSWQKLLEHTTDTKNFKLIKLRRNYGQTAAMAAGIDKATGEYIVTMDADLQNDPYDIKKLIEIAKKGYDVVSGWRKNRKDNFLLRCLPSIIANSLISAVTGVHLHDYGCTLKVYRREVIKTLTLYGEMHRFIPALASWAGCKITEVEVKHHPRRFGKSKYGLNRIIRVILDLITVKFLLKYSTRPIQIFGKLGLLSAITGILMFIVVIAGNISYRLFHTNFAADLIKRPFWVIMPFMLVLFSIQFISLGLLAEIQIRTYYESQNKPIYIIEKIIES